MHLVKYIFLTFHKVAGFLSFLLLSSCVVQETNNFITVADTLSSAQSTGGMYISWKEHLIDGESVNGGLPIRGGDGLKLADLDKDGYMDIVSVHEDSDHVRIAFGTNDPDQWDLITLAHGNNVAAVEDVAIGDLNGDGWPDLLFACEKGHLIYFQNPGQNSRNIHWRHVIPDITKNRGSWLRVFMADVNNDGRLDILAANKGAVDIVDPLSGEPTKGITSALFIAGDPLNASHWTEQILMQKGVPNTAMPVDIDNDGDIDILAASRLTYQMYILENITDKNKHNLNIKSHEIIINTDRKISKNWLVKSNAFHSVFKDIDHDGKDDLIIAVREKMDGKIKISIGWLKQPGELLEPWVFYKIGDILPDWIAGIALSDIDGDGDEDIITGGYSGLNIIAATYSGAARDHDDPVVTSADSVGRITWFANPDSTEATWPRHDISRRVRGMYDEFIPRDMDGDGDIDFIATRGNSGKYDGLFWLEQIRSEQPHVAFAPARNEESRNLPLPPINWREKYSRNSTKTSPK